MSPLNTNFWITFNITAMISESRVFNAAVYRNICTLDGDNQLRNDWQYFASTLVQQIICTHYGKWTIRVDFLSAPVEENGQIVVIIETLSRDLPNKFRVWALVINSDRQISSIIIASELWCWHFPLLEGTAFWWWGLMLLLLLKGRRSSASSTTKFSMLLQRSWHCEFLVRFVFFRLQFLFREVVGREITKGRMWVLGCILILPWFIWLVIGTAHNVLQLVLSCIKVIVTLN